MPEHVIDLSMSRADYHNWSSPAFRDGRAIPAALTPDDESRDAPDRVFGWFPFPCHSGMVPFCTEEECPVKQPFIYEIVAGAPIKMSAWLARTDQEAREFFDYLKLDPGDNAPFPWVQDQRATPGFR